jgi:vitamin B12 transporter
MRTPLFIFLVGTIVSASLRAQQPDTLRDTAYVGPVVVTATRSPLARDRVPASVTVLDGASLRAQGITHLADALRLAPGIAVVQSGSYGAQTALFTRGGQSNYTKVLVDGVPLNDPGGTLDIGTLTLDNVERVEIVRGPTSVLYGSDAVTGVVQLFTRRAAGTPRGSVDARGGTYGSYDIGGEAGGEAGGIGLSIGGAHHASRGIYAFNSAYRNDVASGTGGLDPWTGAQLRASARYADVSAHFPTDFTGAPVDPNAYRTERRTLIGTELQQRLARADVALSVTSNLADASVIDPANDPGGTSSSLTSHTVRQSADLRLSLPSVAALSATLGGSVERQHQLSPDADRRNAAAYAELLRNTRLATVAIGVRVDHSSSYGEFGTYRASVSGQLPGSVRARATVGTAFREPSFFESFDTPFSVANRAIRPERTTSWEAGLERALLRERLTAGVTYFDQRFVDLIDYRFAPSGSTYENIARARAAGTELQLHALLLIGLVADASYTFLDTRVLQSGFSASPLATLREGGPLLRRPKHSASAGLAYRSAAGALVDARVTYVGEREDRRFHGAPTFDTEAVTLDPYAKVDLSAALPLTMFVRTLRALSATLRLDNALAAHYESVAGYATPGRTILAGLRAAF